MQIICHILLTRAQYRCFFIFISLFSGFLTAVLANNWLDDTESSSSYLCLLGGYFDLVLQSCRSQGYRVPEASIFKSALEQLGVEPEQVSCGSIKLLQNVFPNIHCADFWQPDVVSLHIIQAVWLDFNEGSVKAAKGVGMKAVLLSNLDEILEKLSDFTGIQVQKVERDLFQVVTVKARSICH